MISRASSGGTLLVGLLGGSAEPATEPEPLHPVLRNPAPTGPKYLALDALQFGTIIVAFILPGILADTLSLGFIVSIAILLADQALHLYLRRVGIRKVWPIRLNLAFVTIFAGLLVASYAAHAWTLRWFQVLQNALSALFCLATIAVGNPMIADFGCDESHELLWGNWAFHTICRRTTWAWVFVFSFMALCSGVVMLVSAAWSNVLFNYVLQIAVTLVGIKLSYSYPEHFKRKHQRAILDSVPPGVLEAAFEGAAAAPGGGDQAAAGQQDVEAGAATR